MAAATNNVTLTKDDLKLLAFCGQPRSASEIKAGGFRHLIDNNRIYALVKAGVLNRRTIPIEDRQRAYSSLYLYQRAPR